MFGCSSGAGIVEYSGGTGKPWSKRGGGITISAATSALPPPGREQPVSPSGAELVTVLFSKQLPPPEPPASAMSASVLVVTVFPVIRLSLGIQFVEKSSAVNTAIP